MKQLEKHILPDKINKLTIKLKSYAFMKIFMMQTQTTKKNHKIRHYDLELEGATAISGWMKKKLQQVYLRGFYEIKDAGAPEIITLKFIKDPQQPVIDELDLTKNQKKEMTKFRSHTDRQMYQQAKYPSYSSQQLIQKVSSKTLYRSEYGGSNLNSERKSNLMSLLDKVKKVNCQSKMDKQNQQKNDMTNPFSHQSSRVVYSSNNRSDDYKKSATKTPYQQTTRVQSNIVVNNCNDLSFCTYGKTQRVNTFNNFKFIKQHARASQNYTPVTYNMNIEQQSSLDKNNLMSLKKWHRKQKREIIISKINELEKSLRLECLKPQQQYLYNDEAYTSRQYHEIPIHYSQAYSNMKTERHPARSVLDLRVRK